MMKKTTLHNQHYFRFRLDGAKKDHLAGAVVRPAKRKVEIHITQDHVLRALELKGQGNTQNCAGAICTRDHGDVLGHAAYFVDWFESRVFIADKIKGDGWPASCIVYKHNDNVAKLFDTEAGMKKLLANIRKNGPKLVTLYPLKVNSHKGTLKQTQHRGSARDGSRKRAAVRMSGANLRFARMSGGHASI